MLSQASGYAATTFGCIAAMGGTPALVKVVAEACAAPPAYLAKIIHILARNDLVRTQRGVGGGGTLARLAREITLYDVCLALDDPVVQSRCMLGNAACTGDRDCPAHQFCTEHRRRLADFLRGTTIADIAAFETRRQWRAANEAVSALPARGSLV